MVKNTPNIYQKYVTTNGRGKPIVYKWLQKALYGMLKRFLLLYKTLVRDLEGVGFRINPYDPCIVNKIIGGYQMTITRHVDGLKMSHKDPRQDIQLPVALLTT